MSILINTIVKGQTPEGYDQVAAILHPLIREAQGFILHGAYENNEGWIVFEVWSSKKEADDFFAQKVAPNLPKGIIPKRHYQELHTVVTPNH